MDLDTVSAISQIVGTATILGGTIFALFQLSELKKQRHDGIAGDLMRTFMSAELAHALAIVRRFPDSVSADEIRSAGPEAEQAAVMVCTTFETMGLLVFQRIAPFNLVVDLAGGIIVVMWHKLGPWLVLIREEQSQPSWAEWFQWLAQQCERHKDPSAAAYTRHHDWQP